MILLQNQSIKENLAKTAMHPVFLSDLEPQKRALDRIMEIEKESGVRTKQYLATLQIISSFLMGQRKGATIMKQVAMDVMSPAQPMPTIDSIQAWSYK